MALPLISSHGRRQHAAAPLLEAQVETLFSLEDVERRNIIAAEKVERQPLLHMLPQVDTLRSPISSVGSLPASRAASPDRPFRFADEHTATSTEDVVSLPTLSRRSSLRWIDETNTEPGRPPTVDDREGRTGKAFTHGRFSKHLQPVDSMGHRTSSPPANINTEREVSPPRRTSPTYFPHPLRVSTPLSNDQLKIMRLVKAGQSPHNSNPKLARLAAMMDTYKQRDTEPLLSPTALTLAQVLPVSRPLSSVGDVRPTSATSSLGVSKISLVEQLKCSRPVVDGRGTPLSVKSETPRSMMSSTSGTSSKKKATPFTAASLSKEEDYWRGFVEIEEAQRRHYLRTFFRRGETPTNNTAFDVSSSTTTTPREQGPAMSAVRPSSASLSLTAPPPLPQRPSTGQASKGKLVKDRILPSRHLSEFTQLPPALLGGHRDSAPVIIDAFPSPTRSDVAPLYHVDHDGDHHWIDPLNSPMSNAGSLFGGVSPNTREFHKREWARLTAEQLDEVALEEQLSRQKLEIREEFEVTHLVAVPNQLRLLPSAERIARGRIERDEGDLYFRMINDTSRYLRMSEMLFQDSSHRLQDYFHFAVRELQRQLEQHRRVTLAEEQERKALLKEEVLIAKVLLKRWDQHYHIMSQRSAMYINAADTYFRASTFMATEHIQRTAIVEQQQWYRRHLHHLDDTMYVGAYNISVYVTRQRQVLSEATLSLLTWRERLDAATHKLKLCEGEEERSRRLLLAEATQSTDAIGLYKRDAKDVDIKAKKLLKARQGMSEEYYANMKKVFLAAEKAMILEIDRIRKVFVPERVARKALGEADDGIFSSFMSLDVLLRSHFSLYRNSSQYMQLEFQNYATFALEAHRIIAEEEKLREKIVDLEDEAYEDDFIISHQRMRRLDTVRSFIIASPAQERRSRLAIEAEYREGLYTLMELNDDVMSITRTAESYLKTMSNTFEHQANLIQINMTVEAPESAARSQAVAMFLSEIVLLQQMYPKLLMQASSIAELELEWSQRLVAELECAKDTISGLQGLSAHETKTRSVLEIEQSAVFDDEIVLCWKKTMHNQRQLEDRDALRAKASASWDRLLAIEAEAFDRTVALSFTERVTIDLSRKLQDHKRLYFHLSVTEHCDEPRERERLVAQESLEAESALPGPLRWIAAFDSLTTEWSDAQEATMSDGIAYHCCAMSVLRDIVAPEGVLRIEMESYEANLRALVEALRLLFANQFALYREFIRCTSDVVSESFADAENIFISLEESHARSLLLIDEDCLINLLLATIETVTDWYVPQSCSLEAESDRMRNETLLFHVNLIRDDIALRLAFLPEHEADSRAAVVASEQSFFHWLLEGLATLQCREGLYADALGERRTLFSLWDAEVSRRTGDNIALQLVEEESRQDMITSHETFREDFKSRANVYLVAVMKLDVSPYAALKLAYDTAEKSILTLTAAIERGHPSELRRKVFYLTEDSDEEEHRIVDFGWYDGLHRVTDDTIQLLCTIVSKNVNFKELMLSNNQFSRPPIPADGVPRWTNISMPLIGRLTSRLTKLELKNCGLQDSDLSPSLTRYLPEWDCRLESLHLDENDFSQSFCKELYSVLRVQCTMTDVTLSCNPQIPRGMLQVLQFYCQLNLVSPTLKDAILQIEANHEDVTTFSCGGIGRVDDEAVKLICVALFQNQHVVHLNFTGQVGITDAGCQAIASMLRGNASVGSIDLSGTSITDVGLGQIEHVVRSQNYRQPLLYTNLFSAPPSQMLRRRSSRTLMRTKEDHQNMQEQAGFTLSIHHANVSEDKYLQCVFSMNQMERAWIEIDEDESYELMVTTCFHLKDQLENLGEALRCTIDEYDIVDVHQTMHFHNKVFFPAEKSVRCALESGEAEMRKCMSWANQFITAIFTEYIASRGDLKASYGSASTMTVTTHKMKSWVPGPQHVRELAEKIEVPELTARRVVEQMETLLFQSTLERYHKYVNGVNNFSQKCVTAMESLFDKYKDAFRRKSVMSLSRLKAEEAEAEGGFIPQELDPKQHQALAHLARQPWELQGKGLAIAQNDPSATTLDLSYAGKSNPEEPSCTQDTIAILYTLAKSNTALRELNLAGNTNALTSKCAPLLGKLAVKLRTLNLADMELNESEVMPHILSALTQSNCQLETLILDKNNFSAQGASQICRALRSCLSLTKVSIANNGTPIPKISSDFVAFYTDVNKYPRSFRVLVRRLEANDMGCTMADFTCASGMKLPTSANDASHVGDASSSVGGYGSDDDAGVAPYGGEKNDESRPLDDAAVKLLCIALTRNMVVEQLLLGGNRITDKGVKFLSHVLQNSPSLRSIDLSYNEFSDVGAQLLLHLAEKNTRLQDIRLSANNGAVTVQTRRLVAAQLQKNKSM